MKSELPISLNDLGKAADITTRLMENDETKPISEEELNSANWEITTMETECGFPCTPNGCCGHSTTVPEQIWIGSYHFDFPCDDLTGKVDWDNAKLIREKLLAVFNFYAEHHKIP